ncbi:MAG: geranylgeranyl bacteriochlorophyll reductase [Thermosynechococcus sp.]|uniref:geranylgeranyl reductase family protein n=1 Tax=Thermosynechococcus sp. TaxID=2814275 RepID=UPI0022039993|nr:geranylgeranyl reductase family protein [Thermosynechococcus sp.]BCX12214.1 MAG: geranylgeranyl bacteriochlorophyll reductase [Thermosynechococcus sp.]
MYDCIVVGSGPAGGAAAYHLAKRGRRVLVLEKEALPRYKPCGGGVSPQVQSWFDFDFSPAISLKVTQMVCTWQGEEPQLLEFSPEQPMWMVRRDVFDYFLIQQAQRQGAELRPQTPVTGLTWGGDRWRVHTPAGDFTAQYLIGCDGAKGSMAKWLGFRNRQQRVGAAIEIEAAMPDHSLTAAHFDFGRLHNGYIWNFPKRDGYSIGVGTVALGRKQNLRAIGAEYAETFGVDFNQVKVYGHPLYCWQQHQRLHTQNALLAGEAACVVDPFTAEGIRPSLLTGMLAAHAIDRALSGDPEALANYSQQVQQEWGADMIWAKRLSTLFYRMPHTAYDLAVKRLSARQRMGQIFCGQLRYRDVAANGLKLLTSSFRLPGVRR